MIPLNSSVIDDPCAMKVKKEKEKGGKNTREMRKVRHAVNEYYKEARSPIPNSCNLVEIPVSCQHSCPSAVVRILTMLLISVATCLERRKEGVCKEIRLKKIPTTIRNT